MSHTEQLLREALESIVACCDESNTARDYASRQTEIAGIARYALTQTEDGFEGRCPTCLCTTVCNDCAEMGVMDSDLKKYGDPAALSQPAQPAEPAEGGEVVAWSVLDKRTGKHWFTHESKSTAQHYATEYSHRESDGSPSMVVKPLYTTPPASQEQAVSLELAGVQDTIKEGAGFWRSCTGCHESNEGYATGPYSKVFGCALGNGCIECGGLGAIWDDTDYEGMAAFMASSDSEPAQPAVPEDVAENAARDVVRVADTIAEAARFGVEAGIRLARNNHLQPDAHAKKGGGNV